MLRIQPYRSRDELNRSHPEIKNWKCVLQKPRGMEDQTAVRINVLRALERHQLPQQIVYQVGDFFWIPEETTPKIEKPEPRCICLSHIGDNGPCPKHGDPFAKIEGRA